MPSDAVKCPIYDRGQFAILSCERQIRNGGIFYKSSSSLPSFSYLHCLIQITSNTKPKRRQRWQRRELSFRIGEEDALHGLFLSGRVSWWRGQVEGVILQAVEEVKIELSGAKVRTGTKSFIYPYAHLSQADLCPAWSRLSNGSWMPSRRVFLQGKRFAVKKRAAV